MTTGVAQLVPPWPLFAAFLLASLVLAVTPGPGVFYIVTRSAVHGWRQGLVSVVGVALGNLGNAFAAAFGLAALFAVSSFAFAVVKYAGAAYLLFLGIKRLLSRDHAQLSRSRSPRTLRRLYAQGVIVNTLNPKTALFIFALLPQFIEVDKGRVWLQVLVLGLTLCMLGLVSDGLYAFVAGTVADRLRESRAMASVERWVGGTVLVGLGAAAAAVSRPTSS